MIWSPRAISLWRSASESRLIRGRYFSTSFIPEDLCCDWDMAGFFDFTRPIWQSPASGSIRDRQQKSAKLKFNHERHQSCHFNGRNPVAAVGQTGQNPV